MTKYEELMAAYGYLFIEERPMHNKGLYGDGCIWIREDMTSDEKYCILAEEIGHYKTTAGDILDQKNNITNQKKELVARRWAYQLILPKDIIDAAIADGYTEIWDIAEYLEVDEGFLRDALQYYGYLSA